MTSPDNVRWIQPTAGPVRAVVPVPGSKSITNRLLLLAALARGTSRISGILHSDDTDAFAKALSSLGFRLDFSDDGDECIVEGSGWQDSCPIRPRLVRQRRYRRPFSCRCGCRRTGPLHP